VDRHAGAQRVAEVDAGQLGGGGADVTDRLPVASV
jgi:hypothetical protein